MEPERSELSQWELGRLKMLHRVQQKQLGHVAAAQQLRVSDRYLRGLVLLRLREREGASRELQLFRLARWRKSGWVGGWVAMKAHDGWCCWGSTGGWDAMKKPRFGLTEQRTFVYGWARLAKLNQGRWGNIGGRAV
jgi:hypothetical protein